MNRILVIAPNWIGDTLMAQPLLTKLKAGADGCHITVLAPQWVAPVLRYMPEVDSIIPTQLAHGKFNFSTRWQLAKTLRALNFDKCYVLPNSWKSALLPWLARIRVRIGYLGELRYGLLNQYLANPNKTQRPPMIAHYAALANHQHIALTTTSTIPRLNIATEEVNQVAQLFNIDPNKPLLVFCPGAEFGPAKRWPIHHFAELAQLAKAFKPNLQIIALGSDKDQILAKAIGPTIKNLCGATRLEQAIALLAKADAVVCNDSGLMHISAALDRPLIALFGSSDPRHTPPHSLKATPLWLHLSCSPCYQRHCPLKHLRCLQDITPTQVMTHLQKILENNF